MTEVTSVLGAHKLEEVCQGRDLTCWRHLYDMTEELGVTISNLVHRLKDMGWIYLPKDSRVIELIH